MNKGWAINRIEDTSPLCADDVNMTGSRPQFDRRQWLYPCQKCILDELSMSDREDVEDVEHSDRRSQVNALTDDLTHEFIKEII